MGFPVLPFCDRFEVFVTESDIESGYGLSVDATGEQRNPLGHVSFLRNVATFQPNVTDTHEPPRVFYLPCNRYRPRSSNRQTRMWPPTSDPRRQRFRSNPAYSESAVRAGQHWISCNEPKTTVEG